MKLWYFISEAFRSLVEGKMVTVVSIVTVAVTLFFLTVFSLVAININLWVDQYKNEASVVAFFDVTLSDSATTDLFTKIKASPKVSSAKLVSREEAYATFSQLYGKEMLTAVESNPFPASVEIVPSPSIDVVTLKKQLASIRGIESVSVSQEWIDTLKSFRDSFKVAALVLIVIILGVLYFTITNTIKLTVFARMDLLVNMQYIGASWWYVRIPFILEGVIQGMCGALIAWSGVKIATLFIGKFDLFTGGPHLLGMLLAIGAVLGFAGSLDAVRKIPSTAARAER